MAGEILVDYLTTFNMKMRIEKNVLLLLDNAGCRRGCPKVSIIWRVYCIHNSYTMGTRGILE